MRDRGVVFLSLMPIQSHPKGPFRGSDPHNVHVFELWRNGASGPGDSTRTEARAALWRAAQTTSTHSRLIGAF